LSDRVSWLPTSSTPVPVIGRGTIRILMDYQAKKFSDLLHVPA